MTIKKKKIVLVISFGLLFVCESLGMTLFIPPEIFIWDHSFEQALQPDSVKLPQVRVIKQNAVLQIKPKNGAVVIKKLPLGVLLDVEEEMGDWLKITLPPDEDGFILTGYLLLSFTEKGSIIHQ
jgi:hypothetical protein